MFDSRQNVKKIFVIFLIAFFAKVSSFFIFNHGRDIQIFEYEYIAKNLLAGEGFLYNFGGTSYRAFVQPFYPVFTAVIYYFTNSSHIAMMIIQCFISSLLCFIVYSIALRLTGEKEAFWAAAISVFHPGLTVYSIFKLHPLVFDTFFYLLTVALILRLFRSFGNKNALLIGIVSGFALLSRSTIIPFLLFVVTFIFFMPGKIRFKTRYRYIVIICLSAFLIYLPWLVRNYRVFKGFVFMQTCSGENLWVGNNSAASGSAILKSGESIHTKMPSEIHDSLMNLDELNQVKYYKEYFMNFIKKQPFLFLGLFLKKFYYFWWFSPHTGILYDESWLFIYKIYYRIIALFFGIGFISVLKDRQKYPVLLTIFCYMVSLSIVHAIVNVDTRHRWTVEPLMIIFAVIGLSKFFNYFKYSKC